MREITEWFKGPITCEGFRATPGPSPDAQCLWTASDSGRSLSGAATAETDALADIIDRLFPELACRCAHVDSPMRLIHFNNHPLVTRDLIDKVVATYRLEGEE